MTAELTSLNWESQVTTSSQDLHGQVRAGWSPTLMVSTVTKTGHMLVCSALTSG